MNKNDVERSLSNAGIRLRELGFDYSRDREFVEALYQEEEYPIFEHNAFHVLSYLRFKNVLWGVEGNGWNAVGVLHEEEFFLFTPSVDDYGSFIEETGMAARALGSREFYLKNVSEWWLERFESSAEENLHSPTFYRVLPRSREEAVYDVRLLNELKGKDFEKLRTTKNKLLRKEILTFRSVKAGETLRDAFSVLDTWQKVQGYKYAKNKCAKEKYTFERFSEFTASPHDLAFEVGYVGERPLSILILLRAPHHREWGIVYAVKGLNREEEGGMRGISDATYLHGVDRVHEWGLKFLNDGELGEEQGTREHKMRFKPAMFLKSFDIALKFDHQ